MTHGHNARPFFQYDVFATQAGGGNPLAVVLQAEGLNDSQMQAIARWMRLPETTFVLPPRNADSDYFLRIFSPSQEVQFAGHPCVGTAHVLLQNGMIQARDGMIMQDGIAGRLPLRVIGQGPASKVLLRAPQATAVTAHNAAINALLQQLTGPLAITGHAPVLMHGGRRWWLVELSNEASVRSLRPDWDSISALAQASNSMGVLVYARSANTDAYDIVVRALVGAGGSSAKAFEDAASGAANATLAAWLLQTNAMPHHNGCYRVSQGREIGANAVLDLMADSDGNIWSGGQALPIIKGHFNWPSAAA